VKALNLTNEISISFTWIVLTLFAFLDIVLWRNRWDDSQSQCPCGDNINLLWDNIGTIKKSRENLITLVRRSV
jgi:hypothetical protein